MNQPESLPESMTLYPSKVKWILVMTGSIVFLIMGIKILGRDYDLESWIGQIGCIFGGIGILVSLMSLWPDSGWLKLGPDGIRNKILFRKFYYRWSDINRFGISTVEFDTGIGNSKNKIVSFWMKSDDKMHSLGDSYGKKPEQLVKILENYWNRYK